MTIFLCGFMGCGKSTIGKALAEMLCMPLIDTDDEIVKQEGMSIPQIFAEKGEPYFRTVEAETVQKLCDKNAVVSCGGGAMLNPETAAAAREKDAHIILIDQTFEICYDRIKDDKNRPIVQRSTMEQLQKIFDDRAAVYRRQSTLTVSPADTPEETAARIKKLLNLM